MLGIGEKAPIFTVPRAEGAVALGHLLESGPVVLYFFPRAMTPG